jgi:hypothetical protein
MGKVDRKRGRTWAAWKYLKALEPGAANAVGQDLPPWTVDGVWGQRKKPGVGAQPARRLFSGATTSL